MSTTEMSQAAITIEGLSKRYRIGLREERHTTLREAVVRTAAAPLRRLRELSGRHREEETFWALRDVSFEVQPGEVVGIIGRNGAGKSTMLKILSRITEPTEGRATIRGRVASLLEVGTGFHPELTGRENVYLNGSILGMGRREIDRKFDEMVEFAGVEKFIDTQVKHYSSGMKVRLGFAVAAHLEPEILIVDEVLAVGDIDFQKRCMGKMQDVAKGGRTVLFVSHNMAAIQRLCDRVAVLQAGQVVALDATEPGVRTYFELTSSAQERERASTARGGRFELRGLRVHDGAGGPVQMRKPAEFLIPVVFDEPCSDPLVHIFVQTSEGDTIFGFNSAELARRRYHARGREFTFTFRVDSLPLISGTYRLCIKVRSHELQINERIDLGECVQVPEAPLYGVKAPRRQSHGVVAVDASMCLSSLPTDLHGPSLLV